MASYQQYQQPLTTDDGAINSGTAYNAVPSAPVIGYKRRQCGCLWIMMLIGGILGLAGAVTEIALVSSGAYDYNTSNVNDTDNTYSNDNNNNGNNIIYCILLICWGLATIWTQIEDRGEYLLLTYGPCRWLLCGMGKEKVYYRNIRDYQLSKSCFYGFGLPCCTSIKLFNTCSCCCGDMGSFCGHTTIKLTIKERPQGENAVDEHEDCCGEACCLRCCCGDNGAYCGKGCCCQPCCNPCDANFCMMNTIFVSTNDPNGFLQVLNEKVAGNNDGVGNTYATI